MPQILTEVLKKYVEDVHKIYGDKLRTIILYDSYARGDFRPDSDIDIMILTDLNFEEIEKYRDEISDIAFDIELDTGIIISPVIKNIDKYNERVNIVPFFMNVQKEGVVL